MFTFFKTKNIYLVAAGEPAAGAGCAASKAEAVAARRAQARHARRRSILVQGP
jgi:hypothetical protein